MLLGAASAVVSCGDDLGSCDRVAAEELVYSQQGMVATKGQALIYESCGQGTYCHSSGAVGDDRFGAPSGLNFDMLPAPIGWPDLIKHRDEIWSQVSSGHHMNNSDAQAMFVDGDWLFDPRRSGGAPFLPLLDSSEGKGAVRNWLACDAPLVSKTEVPQWIAQSCGGSGDEAFDTLYRDVLGPRCASTCHNASAPGGLNMVDVCRAFEGLAEEGGCGVRLRPGDLGSPLLAQLESRAPECGLPMPPHGTLERDEIDAVRDYIEASEAE